MAFLRAVELRREEVPSFRKYPFSIPALRGLARLDFHPAVTFLTGENGSGKSTLLEAIALAAGLNPEGGSKSFQFATRSSESSLHAHLTLIRGERRERDAFFLRAESLFNVATEIERLWEGMTPEEYGGRSLHEQSHGESFIALTLNRFRGRGLYLLDEPESALSPSRQLALLRLMHDLTHEGDSQFIVATHSPILIAFPNAMLYELGEDGLEAKSYEDSFLYTLYHRFMNDRESYLRPLLAD